MNSHFARTGSSRLAGLIAVLVLALSGEVRATVSVTNFFPFNLTSEGAGGTLTIEVTSNTNLSSFTGEIAWGDGTSSGVGGFSIGVASHTYSNSGTYTVTFTGTGTDYTIGIFSSRFYHTNDISASTTLTIQNAAPTISDVSLPAEVRLSASGSPSVSVNFALSATDPGTSDVVTGIWDFENDGIDDFTGLSGTHTFTTAGTYTVKVKARDNEGAASAAITRQLVVLAPRAPVIGGPDAVFGTVTKNFAYQIDASDLPTGFAATGLPPGLTIDALGKITGIPTTPGEYHITLSATNLIGTTEAELVITIAPIAGSFSGLITAASPTHANTGFCRITTTKTGKLTAVTALAGKKYALKGSFAADGTFSAPLKKATKAEPNPPQISLQFHPHEPSLIDGEIVAADATSSITAYRELIFSNLSPTPLAGKYTFLLPQPDSIAGVLGHGHGSLTIAKNGKISLAGVFSDGTPISQRSALTGTDTWPLFALAYTSKGSAQGWVTFRDIASTSDFDATLRWYKPEKTVNDSVQPAIAAQISLVGSRYEAPAAGASAISLADTAVTLDLAGAPGLFPMSKTVHIEANVVSGPPRSDFTMSLIKSTGLFKGKFFDPVAFKATAFAGAVLQKQNMGKGLFKSSTGTGSVEIGP